MRRYFAVLFSCLVLIFLLGGCQAKVRPAEEPLQVLQAILNEQKMAGPFGKWGWLEEWIVKEVDYDEINGQELVLLMVKTDRYWLLLRADLRRVEERWRLVGLKREATLNLIDVEEPYRYWLRRFVFSASVH
jgi:hypothetical protein